MKALFDFAKKIQSQLVPSVTISTANATVAARAARFETFVSNRGASGAVTFALPAAKTGMRVNAVVLAAQELRLDPNGTETVALPTGVQQAAGKYITADAIGEGISLICLSDGKWDVRGSVGTWTAEG